MPFFPTSVQMDFRNASLNRQLSSKFYCYCIPVEKLDVFFKWSSLALVFRSHPGFGTAV